MEHCVVGIIEKEDAGVMRYLLVSAKKDFGRFTGYYYPPGGHLAPGEDEIGGLVREIKEELRIDRSELLDAGYFSREEMQKMKIWPATVRFFKKFVFQT